MKMFTNQVIKYKIWEWCIDALFDGIHKNFQKLPDNGEYQVGDVLFCKSFINEDLLLIILDKREIGPEQCEYLCRVQIREEFYKGAELGIGATTWLITEHIKAILTE